MLALRLEYLTGRTVATAYNDRGRAEWPPHPARVFSALVATWAEHEAAYAHESDEERQALEWLERLPPPAIACEEGRARTVMTHFVPTNDVSLLSSQEWSIITRLTAEIDEATITLRALQTELAATANVRSESKQRTAAGRVERAQAVLARAQEKFKKRAVEIPSRFSDTDAGNASALFPESRGRQPRTFPSLALPDPVVHLIWHEPPESPHRTALDRLAARLVRVGHSSSLVHARWVSKAPEPTWVPDELGDLLLRVTGSGQLDRLQSDFEQHQGIEPRVLPFRAQRYRSIAGVQAATSIGSSRHFDARNWIILKRVGGPPLPLTRSVDLALAVRGALLRYAESPNEEVLSGHAESGEPSREPHLTIQPLPHVGHRHADGRIMGVALILPRAADDAARRAILRTIGRWEAQARKEKGQEDDEAPTLTLGIGDGIEMEVERQVWGEPGTVALKAETWCTPSAEWMSVTPVALDRNPGDLAHADPAKREAAYRAAAETIALSCENVGLPLPESVTILPSGTWPGGAKAARFPAFPREPGKVRRVRAHARVRFAQPLQGPVILGAGRFVGLGLFKPVLPEQG